MVQNATTLDQKQPTSNSAPTRDQTNVLCYRERNRRCIRKVDRYCGALCPCGSNRTGFTSDTNLSRVLVSVTGNKSNSLEDVGFIGRHLYSYSYNYNYNHHNHWSCCPSCLAALVLLSWSPAC
jgi:hypothetical protein